MVNPASQVYMASAILVLGLLEIGFAFKFLSNADLVLQLGLLQRELFIAIWIAVSLAIAFYLFGWFTLPHDSKVERIGVFRFSLGMVFMMLGTLATNPITLPIFPTRKPFSEKFGGVG